MTAAASAGSTLALPRLDKYELVEEIGHGGMATVYRARDPRLGRDVAVKLIHRHLRENAEVGARFVAEARAAAKLRHPGIVDVFDVSNEDDPERYLVAELVRGTTLRKVLLAHRDMPAEVGAAIVAHLCEAVEHAHASSIIHRDIKPENVLVELPSDRGDRVPANDATQTPTPCDGASGAGSKPRPSNRGPGVIIKITDFGIAKILDAQGVTSTGQVLGSPAHMAPEQIEGGDVDARTDVFALGVLLYECLVGHLPFEGKNPAQVLRRVLDGLFAPADQERPSTGARWAQIVASALAHDPGARVASAAELCERIRAELDANGVSDGKAEIAAYFADPAAYVEAHKARLVPLLIARGEAARKAGNVWGAAADYNRALALAPDDLAIMKRIAGLNAAAGRRILARRLGLIVAGSAALGLGAFGVARAVKLHGTVPSLHADGGSIPFDGALVPPRVDSALIRPEPPSKAPGTASPPPVPEATGPRDTVARVGRIPASPTFTLAPPPAPSVRKVRFKVRPAGAKLSVDGIERNWFSSALELSVGEHRVDATPTDPGCCKKTAGSVVVKAPPPESPNDEQVIVFPMEILPANVSLSMRAPKGAELYCADIGLRVPAGAVVGARLRGDLDWEGSCTFSAPSQPPHMSQLRFKAGESKTVPWPE